MHRWLMTLKMYKKIDLYLMHQTIFLWFPTCPSAIHYITSSGENPLFQSYTIE